MKKIFGVSIIIVLTMFSLVFLLNQQSRINNITKNITDKTTFFPVINLSSINHNKATSSNLLKSSNNKVVVIFNSECDHCNNQINEFINNASKTKDLSVIFISTEPISLLRIYANKVGIDRFNNLQMYHMDFKTLTETFDTSVLPTIYLYNFDNKLVRKFKGEISLDNLIKYLN